MRARIFKHPIHPMLVPLPIGLWIFSFACDLVYRFLSDDALWDDMALYTMAGGIAGALLAALPGFVDYLSLENRATRRVATAHMLVNLTTVGLYAVNLWLRTISPPGATTPIALSIVGMILLSVAGWLGGELVFRHGVAVAERSPATGSEGLRRPTI
ncbi:MAG TPA: DUF2231 domain-containing protein [Gemmatimonadota bacterium]|nr:DUF2231 domain-containing protein [Gemmatimonadota bacterium]